MKRTLKRITNKIRNLHLKIHFFYFVELFLTRMGGDLLGSGCRTARRGDSKNCPIQSSHQSKMRLICWLDNFYGKCFLCKHGKLPMACSQQSLLCVGITAGNTVGETNTFRARIILTETDLIKSAFIMLSVM